MTFNLSWLWSAPLHFKKNTDESSDITKFVDKRFKKDVLSNKTSSHCHYFCKSTYPPYKGFDGDAFKNFAKIFPGQLYILALKYSKMVDIPPNI